MPMSRWVRIPTEWIRSMGLHQLRWEAGKGSANTAALMVLLVIAHRTDVTTGEAEATYDTIQRSTSLSRPVISRGLRVLEGLSLVNKLPEDKRSVYRLANYVPQGTEWNGWAMLPAKRLYNARGNIVAFEDFKLRSRVELDALKLLMLFVAFRDRYTNLANISYDKITEYTGIERGRIKSGLGFLATHSLVVTEQLPSGSSEHGVSNAYRVLGIDPLNHLGTTGRASFQG